MEDWIKRLYKEQGSLNSRMDKLRKFIKGEDFNTLTKHDQKLLKKQMKYMMKYNEVLCKRLADIEVNIAKENYPVVDDAKD